MTVRSKGSLDNTRDPNAELRGVGFVLCLVLVSACSKSATSPAQSGPVTAGASAAPEPKPGDSNNLDYVSVRFQCVSAPMPAAPGKSPVTARDVTYEDFGLTQPARPVQTLVHHSSGDVVAGAVSLEQPTRERLYRAAMAALNQPPTEPERSVPDGETCKLEVFRSVMQLDTKVCLPTSDDRLRPLVNELAQLLPAAN
jgi:hypothetical protein